MGRWLPALIACLALAPLPAGADPAAQRAAFASALALTRAGVAQGAEIQALRDYPLYPYLQAARLQRLIADAPGAATDAEVAAFLDANGTELWTRELRRAWLADLANRRAWPAFLRYYDASVADAPLRCQQLVARWQTWPPGTSTGPLREAVFASWMSADDQPSQCDAVFDWLKQQGALTDEALIQRAQLALSAGRAKLARALSASLPRKQAEPLLRWAGLIQSPQQELEKLVAQPKLPVPTEALMDGFARLARIEGKAALKLYRPLLKKRAIPKAQRREMTRALALGLALDHEPEATHYYREVPDKELDERGHEWRLRAALWQGEWRLALKWIAHLPPAMREQSRWRYWRARALDEIGKHREAHGIYASLIEENGYYSVLAAQRLDRDFTPHDLPYADDPAVQAKLAQLPPLQRAREAAAVGEYPWAGPEWRAGMAGLSAPERLQAARLAADWNLFDQAVWLTSEQRMFDDLALLYPAPYAQEVKEASAQSGLPPALIYSVMRQESLFRPDAVSSAGAVGLLQLLPSSARLTAQRWNYQTPSLDDLKNPRINLPLGAAHLRDHFERYGGRYILALAAYNGGPVRKWLPDEPRDAEIWIENIPYNETRTYVQRILWNYVVYNWRASGRPQNLKEHLAPVTKLPAEGS